MLVLTLVGGLAFWLANFAISRTATAADYRAAMSISYYPDAVGIPDWRFYHRVVGQFSSAAIL